MPFIGNQPALSYTSFAKQDFTTSATTSYTLDHPVTNENELALFINFVRQEPTTAYTASGTSLTLTSATSATDDMYCIYLGKAVQTVNPPNGSVDSSKISYPLTTFSSTGIDDNATSTAVTIDSSENVGIGTTSPGSELHVVADDVSQSWSPYDGTVLTIENNDTDGCILQTIGRNTSTNEIWFGDDDSRNIGRIRYEHTDNVLELWTNNAERMRIDSSGNVRINTTSASQEVNERLTVNGLGTFDEDDDLPLCVNRRNGDGGLVSFRQNGTQEGTITVSGSTVSYNGFTGTHWSRFIDNSKPTILRGTVLETLDEMCDWYNLEFDVTTTTQDEDGNDVTNTVTEKVPHVLADGQSNGDTVTYNHEGTDYQATIVKEADIKHMKSKVSNTTDAKNVYGVFVAYDEDGEGYNDFYVASVGSFVVRIKSGQTIAKGDLLQSNGDGTAKVQTDDNIKSSSFAKVLSTTKIETYEDGSFIVPCSLMC